MLRSKSAKPFNRSRRLHYSWEYKRFFSGSEVFRLSECIVFRIKNDLDHFRLGITLKASGTSVQRNRVKRAIREAFRMNADVLGSHDYNVVISRTKKLSHPFPERLKSCLANELRMAFGKKT